jgi:8-oxo-dGTP pyrophosphatase MutT (NUDIX family)
MNSKTFNNRPNELVTTTDGRKIWVSRSVAVVGVFCCLCMDDEKYYFAIEKRGTNPGLDKQGLWCLPCGYLDWDETGEQAIIREAWEEIGLDIEKLHKSRIGFPSLEQPWFVKTKPNENRQNVTLRYGFNFVRKDLPRLIPNNDCEPNEVADAEWVTYSDIVLGKYEFAFNHDEVIKDYWNRFIHNQLGHL